MKTLIYRSDIANKKFEDVCIDILIENTGENVYPRYDILEGKVSDEVGARFSNIISQIYRIRDIRIPVMAKQHQAFIDNQSWFEKLKIKIKNMFFKNS